MKPKPALNITHTRRVAQHALQPAWPSDHQVGADPHLPAGLMLISGGVSAHDESWSVLCDSTGALLTGTLGTDLDLPWRGWWLAIGRTAHPLPREAEPLTGMTVEGDPVRAVVCREWVTVLQDSQDGRERLTYDVRITPLVRVALGWCAEQRGVRWTT